MLRERIEKDFAAAMKERDAFKVSALRMLRAALKNAEIDKRKPLEEGDVIDVVSKEVKKLKDALESFVAGAREDLAEKTKKEIAILESFLPAAMSEDALRELIRAKIAETGASSPKEFGKVMGEVMKEAKGKADGTRVSGMIKEELAELSV